MCSKIDLMNVKLDYEKARNSLKSRIIICAGTGCVANGSLKIFNKLKSILKDRNIDVAVELDLHNCNSGVTLVTQSGCQGFCQMGPLVTIEPDGLFYVKVSEDDVTEIVEETLINKRSVDRLLYKEPLNGKKCKSASDIEFYKRQSRTVLKNCGYINPSDLNEYIYNDGYIAAEKAYTKMNSEQICEDLVNSGLRGRGGGGFPTGAKWKFALREKTEKKYIICNGDEGDPGAFMDRSIMEGNPHSVIEGMLIAGKAIGADEGYIYVRLEYPLAVARIRKAVSDAKEAGLLGNNVFGTESSFSIHVMEGAGAFVCGEETALMSSIEGKRGMPNPKPPFPAQQGLWGKPTVINNVETLSSIPMIIRDGVEKFRSVGTLTSPGTKTFALTGHVVNTGLIEVPFGTTLREIIYNIGGGVTSNDGSFDGKGFKAVQIGGPSGGCLTSEHLDLPLDFDSLKSIGAMVGSGGLVVMNSETCMVQIAKFFMKFTQSESCGKCVLCREGTKQMLSMLDDITEGRATLETLDLLEQLGKAVQKGSLCGLGKTAPNPVLSTIKQFREEYDAHVIQKRCPSANCKALLMPVIIEEKCKGCGICIKKCPVNAISGEKKTPHRIDEKKCIRCGACIDSCKLKAVEYGV